ncbi:hypothetical protein [Anaeromyxobacter oryzisoli]|uniref:hypothetical protein n=1 Tax=Anaeromyxobacter oryzisoli TaxID=2925408 RepID=UPI001F5973A5|nr:hypothetical protein [Anaeromyxobacter sp. SG63]
MRRSLSTALGLAALAVARPARAHHGVAAVGVEQAEQQGSEGLERFRAAFTFSYSTRL